MATEKPTAGNIRDIDLSEVRAKYATERDRRVRADGIDQFIEVTGEFSYFVDDPYTDERIERAPLTNTTDATVIGGGFGGLLAAINLRKAGIENIRVVEKGGDFGGTWYWNRYPGVQCDIDATIYLPLLEETGYMPSLRYTFGNEIHDYTKQLAERFDLYRDACFQTEVTQVRWLDDEKLWEVQTDRGDAMKSRYLCMANGPLHRPRLPGVPGIDSFTGHTFHTTRWDYGYTGGSIDGDLTGLADKRVAVVGTGATALQCVPHLGASAKELYVVQRTPSSVDERNNRPNDPEWFASLEPGWQQERMDNFTRNTMGYMEAEDLIGDGWADAVRLGAELTGELRSDEQLFVGEQDWIGEIADLKSMERIRQRVDEEVDDPETADLLKAWYRKRCKRAAFHDEYLQTFNRPNVTLLDTNGQGLTKVTETGIVVGDTTYEIDCLIFATGFEVGTSYARRSGYDVLGRGGIALSEKWADGPSTQYGIHTRDFPNLFFLGPIQGSTSINVTQTLTEQAQYIGHIVQRAEGLDARTVEVAADAEVAWDRQIAESGIDKRMAFLASCTPGYYNGEGAADGRGSRFAFEYAAGPVDFFDLLRSWRQVDCLPGVEVDGQRLDPSDEDLAYLRSEAAIRIHLHRDAKRQLHYRDLAAPPRIGTIPVADLRQGFARANAMRGKGPELLSVEDYTIEGPGGALPIRIYRATDKPRARLVFFHGGGGCMGSVDTHDALVRRMAEVTNSAIVSVDYRLAPEAPFPAAFDDAVCAVEWAANNGSVLAATDTPLIAIGDSFGGTLAAAVALEARDRSDIPLAGQVLIYPATSGAPDNPDFDAFVPPILKKEEILWFRSQAAPDASGQADQRNSPIDAQSHADLPPTLVLTAEFDLLQAQGQAYADALQAAGNEVTYKMIEGAMHNFALDSVGLTQSEEVLADVAAFMDTVANSGRS